MAVASLVVGIIGLVLACIPCTTSWAYFLTIPGIIFGFIGLSKAKKTNQGKGAAMGGLICSIIGAVISTVWIIIALCFMSAVGAI